MRNGPWAVVGVCVTMMLAGCCQSSNRIAATALTREEAESLARDAANRESPAGFVFVVEDARREADGWMVRLHDPEKLARGRHCRVFVGDDRSFKVFPGK